MPNILKKQQAQQKQQDEDGQNSPEGENPNPKGRSTYPPGTRRTVSVPKKPLGAKSQPVIGKLDEVEKGPSVVTDIALDRHTSNVAMKNKIDSLASRKSMAKDKDLQVGQEGASRSAEAAQKPGSMRKTEGSKPGLRSTSVGKPESSAPDVSGRKTAPVGSDLRDAAGDATSHNVDSSKRIVKNLEAQSAKVMFSNQDSYQSAAEAPRKSDDIALDRHTSNVAMKQKLDAIKKKASSRNSSVKSLASDDSRKSTAHSDRESLSPTTARRSERAMQILSLGVRPEEVEEIKQMERPSPNIVRLMQAVHLIVDCDCLPPNELKKDTSTVVVDGVALHKGGTLLQRNTNKLQPGQISWLSVQNTFSQECFYEKMIGCTDEDLADHVEVVEKLQAEYFGDSKGQKPLTETQCTHASQSATGLFNWAKSLHHRAYAIVERRKQEEKERQAKKRADSLRKKERAQKMSDLRKSLFGADSSSRHSLIQNSKFKMQGSDGKENVADGAQPGSDHEDGVKKSSRIRGRTSNRDGEMSEAQWQMSLRGRGDGESKSKAKDLKEQSSLTKNEPASRVSSPEPQVSELMTVEAAKLQCPSVFYEDQEGNRCKPRKIPSLLYGPTLDEEIELNKLKLDASNSIMDSFKKQGDWRLLVHESRSEARAFEGNFRRSKNDDHDDLECVEYWDVRNYSETDLDVGDTPRSGAGPCPTPPPSIHRGTSFDAGVCFSPRVLRSPRFPREESIIEPPLSARGAGPCPAIPQDLLSSRRAFPAAASAFSGQGSPRSGAWQSKLGSSPIREKWQRDSRVQRQFTSSAGYPLSARSFTSNQSHDKADLWAFSHSLADLKAPHKDLKMDLLRLDRDLYVK